MKITQVLQEYLLEIEIRKYTQKTIRSYRNNLNLFVRYLYISEEDMFVNGFRIGVGLLLDAVGPYDSQFDRYHEE